MNCKYCGASMRRISSSNPDEIWFKCCNNRCGFEEFLKRGEFEKKETLQSAARRPTAGGPTGPKLCPRCASKMSFDEKHYLCMKCGKMI